MTLKKFLTWFIPILFVIYAFAFFMPMSKSVCINYKGLAADSEGNLYLGEDEDIRVYDAQGNFLRSFSANTNRGYRFTIVNDHIIEFLSGDVLIMNLSGEVTMEYDDSELSRFEYSINPNKFTATDGTTYQMKSWFLRDRVYRTDTSSHSEVIYEMPLLSYIVKIDLVISIVSMIIVFPIIIITGIQKQIKRLRSTKNPAML